VLSAPLAAQAQTTVTQPPIVQPPVIQPNGAATPTATVTNAAISGQPQPGPADYAPGPQGYAAPMPVYPQPGFTPRTVWIPGGYNWDPGRNIYVWTDGQYVEAPRENAQWVPGHWMQTPSAWIWVDGRWN